MSHSEMSKWCEWRHAPEARAEDLGDFEKSQLVEFWVLASGEDGWFSGLAKARPVALCRVHTWFGADGKVIIESLCISLPYVEKPFNSKVIKFRTWTKKSLRVFRVSRFLCSMYICYEHSMYVSHIRIMGMLHEEYSTGGSPGAALWDAASAGHPANHWCSPWLTESLLAVSWDWLNTETLSKLNYASNTDL